MSKFLLLVRYICFITVSVLWPVVLLPFCRFAVALGFPLFDFVFLVYPGATSQVTACVPIWYRNLKPMPSVVGIMSKGKGGQRGLVVAVPWTMDEMEEKNNFLENTVKKIEGLAESVGAKTAALGGRTVTVLSKRGHRFELPTVAGDRGAVYAVSRSIHQALKSANLKTQGVKVGVLGYGFLGSRLGFFLKNAAQHNITAVDPRFTQPKEQDGIRLTSDPSEVLNCDVIVVLTPKGEQVEDEIRYFKVGAIVVDDTYPSLPRRAISAIERNGGRVVKAGVSLEGVRFWPKLPGWGVNRIPGCCVEAMVIAATGDIRDKTQEDFNTLADRMGFGAP